MKFRELDKLSKQNPNAVSSKSKKIKFKVSIRDEDSEDEEESELQRLTNKKKEYLQEVI